MMSSTGPLEGLGFFATGMSSVDFPVAGVDLTRAVDVDVDDEGGMMSSSSPASSSSSNSSSREREKEESHVSTEYY